MGEQNKTDTPRPGDFPEEERERVKELLRYNILDTPDEEEFDEITKVATYLCDVDCAQINFLNYDRQWSKSCHGWDVREIPRNQSICTYTIQQDKFLVVNDVSKDPRFKDYGYVKDKSVQFYAGVVLKTEGGYNIGTLCVFDKEPRELSDDQLEALQILGRDIEAKLELRLKREQLLEEHKKLKRSVTFLRNSTDLLFILDPDTLEIEEVNEEATELLGFSHNEIVGSRLTDLIPEEEFIEKLETWRANGAERRLSHESSFKTDRDKPLWLQITITEEQDRLFVTARNITHRKQTEQRLQEQVKFTEDIIHHLPGIFFLVDKEGKIKKWNNNLGRADNRTYEEVKNRHYRKFIAPEDHDTVEKALETVLKNGFAHTELGFLSREGEVTPLLLSGFRYRVGGETFVIGIGINISEEKKAREELEHKEQMLEEAQRIARMGSWRWDIAGDSLYWSDEVYELLGLDKESFEPSLKKFSEMLPPSEQKKVAAIVERIMRGEKWEEIELQLIKPDGSLMYVHERGEVHYDDEGNPIEVTGTMQDVTARRKAEEKIKDALEEKEVLLAEVHHRVKNNLAIINSLLQLEIFNSEDPKLKEVLSDSQMRIKSMALIHESLYSAGDFANISFEKYLSELSKTISKAMVNNEQQIEIQLDTEKVILDINQAIPCALIFNELLTNAINHAFPGGREGKIRIALQKTDGHILLGVEDNGVGMDDSINLEDPKSLGLTLVKSLAKQLDGTISMERKEGLAFHLKFRKKKTKGASANIFLDDQKSLLE